MEGALRISMLRAGPSETDCPHFDCALKRVTGFAELSLVHGSRSSSGWSCLVLAHMSSE